MRLNSGRAQAKYMVRSVSWWICTALARACWSRPLLWPDVWLPSALQSDVKKRRQTNQYYTLLIWSKVCGHLPVTPICIPFKIYFKHWGLVNIKVISKVFSGAGVTHVLPLLANLDKLGLWKARFAHMGTVILINNR